MLPVGSLRKQRCSYGPSENKNQDQQANKTRHILDPVFLAVIHSVGPDTMALKQTAHVHWVTQATLNSVGISEVFGKVMAVIDQF